MREFRVIFILLIQAFWVSNVCAGDLVLKLEHSYEYDTVFSRIFFDAVVDRDGDLIVAFGVPGCMIVAPKELKLVAPAGEGPGDLSGYFALNILDNQDLCIEGFVGKMHVFKKTDGLYKWDRTEYRELKKSFAPTDTLFFQKKWYVAVFSTFQDKKNGRFTVDYLQVFSDKGKFIKNMIQETYDEAWKIAQFYSFLVEYKKRIFFLSENKLFLRIITGEDPKVSQTVNLEHPKFYKRMPETFYHDPIKGRMITSQEFWKNMALWKTGYSRICNVLIDGHWLIVQVRTADANNKRFGLLFYDADTFELKHTIMTDDLLLANKNGKLYFFRGGNPTWEEVDETIFDIYKIVEKK